MMAKASSSPILTTMAKCMELNPNEFVEITNESKSDIDISGYSVVDLSHPGSPQESVEETFTFPTSTVLNAGQCVRVYNNEIHSEYGGNSLGSGKAIWNDWIARVC